jgi:hypothetical protein
VYCCKLADKRPWEYSSCTRSAKSTFAVGVMSVLMGNWWMLAQEKLDTNMLSEKVICLYCHCEHKMCREITDCKSFMTTVSAGVGNLFIAMDHIVYSYLC